MSNLTMFATHPDGVVRFVPDGTMIRVERRYWRLSDYPIDVTLHIGRDVGHTTQPTGPGCMGVNVYASAAMQPGDYTYVSDMAGGNPLLFLAVAPIEAGAWLGNTATGDMEHRHSPDVCSTLYGSAFTVVAPITIYRCNSAANRAELGAVNALQRMQ